MGIGDHADADFRPDTAQQLVQKRGLARPDFSGDQRDRRLGQQAIFQHGISAAVRFRPEQKIRIGHQRKRALGQSEMRGIDIERADHIHF